MTIRSILRRTICAGALFLGCAVAQDVQAANFVVTNTNDSGPGSLRQAVQDANSVASNDTITFDKQAFRFSSTIKLVSGELVVVPNGTLSINGLGSNLVIISGNSTNRMFNVALKANLSLSRLELSEGYNRAAASLHTGGGAIFNEGTLTLSDMLVAGNRTIINGYGGAIYNSGGFVTINNCQLDSNTTLDDRGNGGGEGGAIYSGGEAARVIINGGTFSGNSSGSGGVIRNDFNSTLTANQCIFSYNSALGGGAVFNSGLFVFTGGNFLHNKAINGGALFNAAGNAILRNCTCAYNTATEYGGVMANNTNSAGRANLTVESCTVVFNTGQFGGAIFNISPSRLVLNNSIITNSTIGENGQGSIYGPITEANYNLVDVPEGVTLPGSNNIVNRGPLLGTLAYNGGPLQNFAPSNISPVIDAGNSTLSTDQRGFNRPISIAGRPTPGNGSDIGAFEVRYLSQNGPNFVVTKTDDHDDGSCDVTDCTLREAITAANNDPDTSVISFSPIYFGLSKNTIPIKSSLPLPPITSDMSINGPTALGTGVTVTGINSGLTISGGVVNISNLTFSHAGSGGIINFGGALNVHSCTFDDCNIGIQNGNGEYLPLTVTNSTFVNNQLAGIFSSQSSTGNLAKIDSCTFTQNTSGLFIQGGVVEVTNSIIAGNSNDIEHLGGVFNNRGFNLIGGTSQAAGLDPIGLKDNGGPTPTVALLPTSRAINVGKTTLTSDQRGLPRVGTPDIGAYENAPPSVVSLSPQNVTDKVGAKRTFTLTVSDASGAADIKEVTFLINDRLSTESGVVFRYVPRPGSPTDGQLYLRYLHGANGYLQPIQIGMFADPRAVLDNGAVNLVSRDAKVTSSGGTLTISLSLTIRDGLVGNQRLFARVVDRGEVTDPATTPSDSGYRRFGTYTVLPQFAGVTNNVPTLSRLTPATANSQVFNGPIKFSFFAADPDGTGDIDSVWFMVGKEINWARSATFVYTPRTRQLYLRSDDGNSFLGGGVIGTEATLQNSKVRVRLSDVRVLTYGDGKTLGFVLPVEALNGLLGQNKIWLRVQDRQGATAPNGDDQGYVQSGTWNLAQSTAPRSNISISAAGS
ncbi:CSLREA domain-containing protein [bacterium]|nr:MAG: CSLREA domain-containing protein [bacterium]